MNIWFWVIIIAAIPFVIAAATRIAPRKILKGHRRPLEPRESVPSISDETDPGAPDRLPSEWYEEDK